MEARLSQGGTTCTTHQSGGFSGDEDVILNASECHGFNPFRDIVVEVYDTTGDSWCINGDAVTIDLDHGIKYTAHFSKDWEIKHTSTAKYTSGDQGKCLFPINC